jgi:hypothetical protein
VSSCRQDRVFDKLEFFGTVGGIKMRQTRQQLIKSTIGSKTVTFAARDINGPPPTLNIAVKGQPEAHIVN